VLDERGFDEGVLQQIMVIGPLIGMASNLFCGWLAQRVPLERLLAVAMALMALSLAAFPFVTHLWHVYTYTVVYGVAGGMSTVLLFSVCGRVFGGTGVGAIRAAAEVLTVLASALGPLVVELSRQSTGSYTQFFAASALVSGGLSIAACLLPMPDTAPAVNAAAELAS
jgi:MFS family permease